MRVGINGSDKLLAPDLGAIAADIDQAEADGFASYWMAQTTLLDAISGLAIAASGTSTITVGTAVVPTWTRHPQVAAAAALTAQAATGGRFVLGIGLLHQPVVEHYLHMKWERPIRHMLDYLDVLQPLLTEGTVDHRGEVWSYTGTSALSHDRPAEGDARRARRADAEGRRPSHRRDDPVVCRPEDDRAPDRADHQRRRQRCRASRAGDRVQPSRLGDRQPRGRRAEFLAQILGNYSTLPSYRAMLDIEGVHGIDGIALVGSEQEVSDGLAAVAESGATDFAAVVMGGNPDELGPAHRVPHAPEPS